MADHAGHNHAAAAAPTLATTIANATTALASDVVNSDLAHDVSDFLSALSPEAPAVGGHGAHGGHEGHHGGHGDHGAMAGHHMMKMWFHGGVEEVILFDWWRTDSCVSLLISCIIIFAMGALYEGVKWFRVYLQMNDAKKQALNMSCDETTVKSGCRGDHVPLRDVGHEEQNGFGPTATPPVVRRGNRMTKGTDAPFSAFRLIEASLYALQLVLAYWLMLIVMTYNTWLTIAVIAGAAFGHWLFAILNILSPSGDRHDSFTTDACH